MVASILVIHQDEYKISVIRENMKLTFTIKTKQYNHGRI